MRTRCSGALCIAALLLFAGCSKQDKARDSGPAPKAFTDAEYVTAFNRGVNEIEQHRFVDAATTFDELARSRPGLVAPWINLASAQLNRNVEAAHPLSLAAADRATALDPKAPQPHFLRGILFKHLGRFEDAERNFRETLKHAPDDPATLYHLASVVAERDVPQAVALLEKALEGQTHLSSAYYSLMGLKRRVAAAPESSGTSGSVEQLMRIFQAFEAANTGAKMNIVYTEMGRLGEALRDLPIALPETRPAAGEVPKFGFSEPVTVPGMALAVIDVNGKPALVCRTNDGNAPDDGTLVVHGWNGSTFAPMSPALLSGVMAADTHSTIAPGDFDEDGHDDLAIADGASLRLLAFDGTAFRQAGPDLLGEGYRRCTWSDLDQDGDLDLLAWNESEIVALINRRDGTFERYEPRPSTSRPAFQTPPLPKPPAGIRQVVATDLDGDGDPDLVFASDEGIRLWRNDRLMRFADVSARAGLGGATPASTVLAVVVDDLDGDRILDILAFDAAGFAVYRQPVSSAFALTFTKTIAKGLSSTQLPRIGDLDCDGQDEILVCGVPPRKVAIHSIAELSGPLQQPATLDFPNGSGSWLLLADLNGDLALDVIGSNGKFETRVYLGRKPPWNHALGVRLQGRKFANTMHSNMGGIGARVEVMTGNRTRVREVRSTDGYFGGGPTTLHFGLGAQANADYVRIVWPDDVLQSEGWVPGDQIKVIEEFQRKASSCPILFAWNGERFECVTDFLGTGGLGFLLEPGVWGPPDPTEKVLIPRLAPRDGKLEIRIHEPFEEITYLDAAKLIVVDHPVDVDVVPDERFAVNAPQPDGGLLAIKTRIDPIASRDGRRNDVLDAILRSDRKHAHAVADPRFIGYAEPTTFELDFGAGLTAHAGSERLFLALDGWVEYPYSHVNLAAWQAGLRIEALSVEVEVAGQGFVRVRNEACYPAGMPRIMTLPLGRLPGGLTGRLRLITNQELWIDRLFLFEPADAKLETRTLLAASAQLRASGFPREYSPDGGVPRLYDYDIRDPSFPWKTMAGAYTRFGDVKDLLGDADDCYVVFGPGEEVALTFAPPPPPAPGMKRTFILDSFGWCKDMDPCTAFPYTVEPLPFRGMSNYPYRDDESFPDGPAQRAWRETYQTRVVPGTRAR